MPLRVPINKADATGMRLLASPGKMKTARTTLKGRARVKRTMWSRRAQEYEAKINSGNPISIAEVLRDLYRLKAEKSLSFGERQMLDKARTLIVKEIAVARRRSEDKAIAEIEAIFEVR